MLRHTDHVHSMDWYNISWDTWLHGITWDYMGLHGITWDYMGLHGITWDYMGYTLTTRAIYAETYWPCRQYGLIQYIVRHSDHVGNIYCESPDHVGNICWDTLTMYTAWIDTIYHEPLDHMDRLMRYMVIHSDHMDWYNISWYTRPHGIIWDTLWPCGQYMLRHTDHVHRMDWYNISWATRPREQYMLRHAETCWDILTM